MQPDLVFLDVQMPEMDGFQVVEAIGVEQMPATIFVTAFDRYAIRAFDACAVDYLLSPSRRTDSVVPWHGHASAGRTGKTKMPPSASLLYWTGAINPTTCTDLPSPRPAGSSSFRGRDRLDRSRR